MHVWEQYLRLPALASVGTFAAAVAGPDWGVPIVMIGIVGYDLVLRLISGPDTADLGADLEPRIEALETNVSALNMTLGRR